MRSARGPIAWALLPLASLLALSACGQGSAATPSVAPPSAPVSASTAPAKPAASAPASGAAKPAGSAAASVAAKPAASGSAATTGSADWDTVVAAGKREGKVSLIGPPGDQVRSVLVDAFEKQYGITVDYNALPGNAVASKVNLERQAGQYNWDVLVAGSTGTLRDMIPNGDMDPIESQLILPEVKDPKNWRGGALPVMGPNHEILTMTPYQRGIIFYNTAMVKGDEFKSYKDLLDPKWKDKLQTDDPRRPGPGQATFTFFYLHPDLGADFIRSLAKQNLTMLQDYQQEVDMVGQGRAPVVIGAADYLAEGRLKQGAPIGIVPSTQLKEGSDISAANGDVAVFNKAPHPNAMKVYVNWLLTKDEQTAFAKANGFTDGRVDVTADWTESWRAPAPGAIETDGDAAVKVIYDKVLPLLKEALG